MILTLLAAALRVTQPSGDLIDQPVKIEIHGLAPLEIVELEAKTTDQKGETWSSHAFFQADEKGEVDGSQTPLPGSSYEMADGMGLFWSMRPSFYDPSLLFKCKEDRMVVEIALRQEDRNLEKTDLTRYLKSPDVEKIDVRENGLVGTLFLPPSEKPLPAIITLSGSGGGLSETRAKLLASHGFSVLALGYFGIEGLPSRLANIPLEYFETAITWLKNHPRIEGNRIGLYGVSRGGELALLLGSTFPDSVQAIAASVPSSVVHGGLSEKPVDGWTYEGIPLLPFAPVVKLDVSDGTGRTPQHPAKTRENFLQGMKNKEAYEAASIPVEKIHCPILLISAGDDQLWPSDLFAKQILTRLANHHSMIERRHFHYPAAGHGITVPHLPTPEPLYLHPVSNLWLSFGGNRASDAQASAGSWAHLLAFFEETLKPIETMREKNQKKLPY